jgi:hypothetical protein
LNAYMGIRFGVLYLALPGDQISQINLPNDLHRHLNMPYITLAERRIPVLQVDEQLSQVSAADSLATANTHYIISLAYADASGALITRFALQVDAVQKLGELEHYPIPILMQRPNSPLLGLFTDQAKQPGFVTDVQALERFFNHLIETPRDDHDYPLAG